MARGERICMTCKQSKPLTEYHYKNKAKGTRQDRCSVCAKEYAKAHYESHKDERLQQINERQKAMRVENRKLYEEFLNLGKCSVCGEEDFRCLTSNICNEDLSFKKTDDLKVLISKGVIKCLNCDVKTTPL